MPSTEAVINHATAVMEEIKGLAKPLSDQDTSSLDNGWMPVPQGGGSAKATPRGSWTLDAVNSAVKITKTIADGMAQTGIEVPLCLVKDLGHLMIWETRNLLQSLSPITRDSQDSPSATPVRTNITPHKGQNTQDQDSSPTNSSSSNDSSKSNKRKEENKKKKKGGSSKGRAGST
jgi:hypothetical protein